MKMLIPSISSAIALFALTATAAEYTVTSNADSGEGTLRALCATVAMGDTIFIPGDIGPIALASEINLAPAQKVLRFVGIGEGENRPVITGVGSHRTFVIGRQIMAGVGTKHEFRNLIFRNITSNADGAAIYLNDYAPTGVTISNCLFEACSAPAGGAIRLNRIDQWYEIQDCVFKDCVSADGYALCGGKVKVERCWFEGNQSTKNASCFGAQAGGANIFTDCVFTNNVGINGGCVSVAQTPTNFFTRCVFVDNEDRKSVV